VLIMMQLIKLEEMVLTHINNPNKRRAGRSTSKTTIDWTSISQVPSRTLAPPVRLKFVPACSRFPSFTPVILT
jgi:hypothetical protein